ncbi:MAG: tetratricopeptide repeat protein [Synergistaceae bacterium]|nr:tetratricopeptide repeat protein [Synergistaceae bacterium]
MCKRSGKFSTYLVSFIVLAVLCATGYLVCETMKNRYLSQGDSLLRSHDYSAAYEAYGKANKLSIRPRADILRGLAESAIGMGDEDAASGYYEKLLKLEPGNAKDRYTLGRLCIKTKDYKTAEKQIRALRDINTPESIEYADKLTGDMQVGAVKGFIKDLFRKMIPGFDDLGKALPGLGGSDDTSKDTGVD